MIPKIIHYCWFGGNNLPNLAVKCIESWRKFCPDFEIKCWDEKNFDINCCDFVKEAYEAKKWAFVSDYARFWILYNYGGVYFDTDVEMIKPIKDILEKGSFMGLEGDGRLNVNPGLGMAALPKEKIYSEILDMYSSMHFLLPNGSFNQKPVGEHVTNLLIEYGFQKKNIVQHIKGITIYPIDYFCPKNVSSEKLCITRNTRTIHHYTASWYNNLEKLYRSIENRSSHYGMFFYLVVRMFTLPLRVINKISGVGLKEAIIYIPLYIRNNWGIEK